jgi:hypothetical protein
MLPVPKYPSGRDKMLALQQEVLKLEQYEPETNHIFADGLYCREVPRPAGILVIGKVHKQEHLYIITKGRVLISDGDTVKEYEAGDIVVSKPGTKRATYAVEDSICLTVHRTDTIDVEELDEELYEYDPSSRYDAYNRLIGANPCAIESIEQPSLIATEE